MVSLMWSETEIYKKHLYNIAYYMDNSAENAIY